jgi:hypothetical protein
VDGRSDREVDGRSFISAAIPATPALPDCQSDPWPMLDCRFKDLLRLIEIVASVEHSFDPTAILGPLLDLVVIALVGDQWLVSLFVEGDVIGFRFFGHGESIARCL